MRHPDYAAWGLGGQFTERGEAMTHLDISVGSHASHAIPIIRKIRMADLKDALAKGIEDFWAVPTHAIFLCIIYPVAALVLAQWTLNNNLLHLFFPLAAGFALIGPVAALGAVAGLVGIEGGVVSGVFNLESLGVRAPSRRPRHDKRYHEARTFAADDRE